MYECEHLLYFLFLMCLPVSNSSPLAHVCVCVRSLVVWFISNAVWLIALLLGFDYIPYAGKMIQCCSPHVKQWKTNG